MGYSIGLKTKSEKKSKEILDYILNIASLSSIINSKEYNYYDVNWCLGNDLSYIEDDSNHYIGLNGNTTDDLESAYIYSIIYAVAFKYGLTKKINGIDTVLVNYDGSDTFHLAKENPFSEKDGDLFFSHVSINEDGLKLPYKRTGVFSFLHLGIDKKHLELLKNIINNIK
jgi:hypothetical protein